jgi:hypothetical protein
VARRREGEDGQGRAHRRGHFLQSRQPSWDVPKVMVVRGERMEKEEPSDGCAEDEDKGGRNQESPRVIIPYLFQDERFQHVRVVATNELSC